ncbi:MAG: threonine/serine exporter family protein [Alistipes indistinctus]
MPGRYHPAYVSRQDRACGIQFRHYFLNQFPELEAHDEHLSFRELTEKYERIIRKPRISRWWVLVLVTAANACFCRLFGGDVPAMRTRSQRPLVVGFSYVRR